MQFANWESNIKYQNYFIIQNFKRQNYYYEQHSDCL